ncbi:hypothetical protein LX36DRAFT_101002 [Colletotrichum falcatum]|nr:hypothetical protein LX36DRAFT_101002 [Colletotrichum falcatum]
MSKASAYQPFRGSLHTRHRHGIRRWHWSPAGRTQGPNVPPWTNDTKGTKGAMEDRYFHLMRTNWEGEDALEDLGFVPGPPIVCQWSHASRGAQLSAALPKTAVLAFLQNMIKTMQFCLVAFFFFVCPLASLVSCCREACVLVPGAPPRLLDPET